MSDAKALAEVSRLLAVRDGADVQLTVAMREARAAGATLQQIADAAHMTRAAVHYRLK